LDAGPHNRRHAMGRQARNRGGACGGSGRAQGGIGRDRVGDRSFRGPDGRSDGAAETFWRPIGPACGCAAMNIDDPNERPLAVAMNYEEGSREASKVVVKGRGLVAEKIIAIAEENGVVIEANPVLAKALSGVELHETIPIELYDAMAVVIGYVLRQTRR